MDAEEKFRIIKRNTEEIVSEEELKQLLKEKENPSGYIGLATTGRIHVGYFIPLMKVADFIKAGFKFKILLADIHAHLDDMKTPFELLNHRVEYYKQIIIEMAKVLGVEVKNLEFIQGSEFQLSKEYTLDMYKLSALNTFDRCKRAASEVVRFGEAPKLSGFIYPILQALDEQYLDVDVQFGGIDQRKILMFARENLPKLGYKARIEVMTPMLPGLTGSKMSASGDSGKIDILDESEVIIKKIKNAFCPIASLESNGVMAFLKNVLMVLKEDRNEEFIIKRPEKFGGDVVYKNYAELEKDYLAEKLHPQDLKTALADELVKLLDPIREAFKNKSDLLQKAYPN